jgi:hypothetical protein
MARDANGESSKTNVIELLNVHGLAGAYRALKALALYRKVHSYVDLLIDVHGYLIFQAASFSGDPHPGSFRSTLAPVDYA